MYKDLGLTGYVKRGYHEIVDYTSDGVIQVLSGMNVFIVIGSNIQALVNGEYPYNSNYPIK